MSQSTNKAPLSSILSLLHHFLDPVLRTSSASSAEESSLDLLDLDDILNVLDAFAHVELLDNKINRIASQALRQLENQIGKGKGKARDDGSLEDDMARLVKLVERRRGRNGKIGRRGLYFAFSMMLRQNFINSVFLAITYPYSPTIVPILQALLPYPSTLPSVAPSPGWRAYLLTLSDEEKERAERCKRLVNGGERLFLRCVRSGLENDEVGEEEEGIDEVAIMITALENSEDLLLQLDNHEIPYNEHFDPSHLPHTPSLARIGSEILKYAYQTNRDKLVLEGILNGIDQERDVKVVDFGDEQGGGPLEIAGYEGDEQHRVKGENEYENEDDRLDHQTESHVKREEVDELDEQGADEMMDTVEGESSDSPVQDQGHDRRMETPDDEDPIEDLETRRQHAMQQALERMLSEPGTTWTVLASGDIVKVDLTSLSRPSESPMKRKVSPRQTTTPVRSRSRFSIGPSREVERQRERERVISAPSQMRRRPSVIPSSNLLTPRVANRRHTEGPSDARQRRAAEVEMLRGGAGDPIGRTLENEDSDDGMKGDDEPVSQAMPSGNRKRLKERRSRHSIAGLPGSTSSISRSTGQGYDRPTSTSLAKARENGSSNKRHRPFQESEVIRSHKKPRAG